MRRVGLLLRGSLIFVCVFARCDCLGAQRANQLMTVAARTALRDGLEFLAKRQNDDGSFGSSDQSRDVGVASLCGLGFLSQGSTPGRGPYGKQVAKCVGYVLDCSDNVGFISTDEQAVRPMYGHGFSTLFLSDVYGMAPQHDVRERLSKAIRVILKSQNDDGGWRYQPIRSDADVSVTVVQIMALRAARNAGFHVPEKSMRDALNYVRRCQNSDGGFAYQQTPGPSMFARSAAAVAAFHCVGDQTGNQLERGQRFLHQFALNSKRNADQEYFYYGHYYAAFSMLHTDGFEKWFVGIRDELVRRQNKETGAWETKVWSAEYSTAVATIILQIPYGKLPIFAR